VFWGHLISSEYPSYEERGGFMQPPLRVVGIILHYKMRQVDQSIFLFIPKWDNLLKAFFFPPFCIFTGNARLKWMYLSNWSPIRIIEHWIHVDKSKNYTIKRFEKCQVSPLYSYKEQNEHLEFFQLKYDKSAPFDYFT
jgi:hypothetical protein